MQSYEKQIVDARNAMANGENPLLDEAGLDELRQKAERDIAYIKEAVEKRQQIHGQEVAKEAELKELKERSSREQAERAIAQQQQEEQVAARQVEATQQTAQPEAPKEVKEQKLGFFERRKQEQVKQGASEAAAAISRLQSSGYLEGTYLSPDQQKALQEEINSSLDSLYQITSGESSGSESVVSRAQKLQERLENIAIKVKQDRGEMLTKEEQKRLKKM